MAIAVGSATDFGALTNFNDGTISHNSASGTDRALIVAVVTDDGTGEKVTAIDYNGDSMTKEVELDAGNGDSSVSIWSLINPDTGTNNLNFTTEGALSDITGAALTFTGVDQTDAVEATASNSVTNGSPTVSITTLSDDSWLVDAFVSEQGAILSGRITVDSPQTERALEDFGADGGGASDKSVGTAGSYTMSWTDSDDDEASVSVVVALKPAGGAPAPTYVPRIMVVT